MSGKREETTEVRRHCRGCAANAKCAQVNKRAEGVPAGVDRFISTKSDKIRNEMCQYGGQHENYTVAAVYRWARLLSPLSQRTCYISHREIHCVLQGNVTPSIFYLLLHFLSAPIRGRDVSSAN